MSANRGDIRIEEPSRAQRAIARRAAESRATIPHLELSAEVGIGELDEPGLLASAVHASARALRAVPRANGAYRDGRFELYSRVNIGVALATDDAYAVPTVFDADGKKADEIASEVEALRGRAIAGELLAPELSGGTFTVFDSAAMPLVVPGQAASLSVGRIREAAIVCDGAVVAGRVATLGLACDHRILYADDAERFLAAIAAAFR